jgi:hypothetical protein
MEILLLAFVILAILYWFFNLKSNQCILIDRDEDEDVDLKFFKFHNECKSDKKDSTDL